MAIDVSKIQKAISEVLSGINDGVMGVGSVVANVAATPPEKVIFQIDAVTVRDFFERAKIVQIAEKKQVTHVGEVTARDEFRLNGALVETVDYVDSTAYVIKQTTSASELVQKEYENNSVGVILEIEGPKNS
jgi:hypothetical protein